MHFQMIEGTVMNTKQILKNINANQLVNNEIFQYFWKVIKNDDFLELWRSKSPHEPNWKCFQPSLKIQIHTHVQNTHTHKTCIWNFWIFTRPFEGIFGKKTPTSYSSSSLFSLFSFSTLPKTIFANRTQTCWFNKLKVVIFLF
jgi:hypothetical protein